MIFFFRETSAGQKVRGFLPLGWFGGEMAIVDSIIPHENGFFGQTQTDKVFFLRSAAGESRRGMADKTAFHGFLPEGTWMVVRAAFRKKNAGPPVFAAPTQSGPAVARPVAIEAHHIGLQVIQKSHGRFENVCSTQG